MSQNSVWYQRCSLKSKCPTRPRVNTFSGNNPARFIKRSSTARKAEQLLEITKEHVSHNANQFGQNDISRLRTSQMCRKFNPIRDMTLDQSRFNGVSTQDSRHRAFSNVSERSSKPVFKKLVQKIFDFDDDPDCIKDDDEFETIKTPNKNVKHCKEFLQKTQVSSELASTGDTRK